MDNFEATVSEIYPNPAKDNVVFLVMTNREMKFSYSLMNSHGQIVLSMNNQKVKGSCNNFFLNIKGLSNGIYFLEISLEGKNIARKLVIDN